VNPCLVFSGFSRELGCRPRIARPGAFPGPDGRSVPEALYARGGTGYADAQESDGPPAHRPRSTSRPSGSEPDVRKEFLPFSPPFIGEEEIAEVVAALRSGWITTGPRTRRFEEAFAAYLGAPAALALSSGTAAMHVTLVALGIGPGDEVITSTMTFCSTAHIIEQAGARPVLVDIEPDTMNLDPARVAEAVTSRTRAILAVHYGGHPCDLDALQAIAEAHDLVLIEDAAHALPAGYRGRTIGAGDNPVAFSFYATKNLTTGEGGMLTGEPDFLERARVLSLHGMSRDAWRRYDKGGSWYYEVVACGFKYNMTDIQAALGLAQLARLDAMQQRRREVVAAYDAAFADLHALELPARRDDVEHAWHLYPLRLQPDRGAPSRDDFIAAMARRNIGTSVHFIPVHLHPYYRARYGWQRGDFPVAEDCYDRLVTIPLNPTLTDEDVKDVVEGVRCTISNCSR
jgi:dTDP-4-amino-4,6-dideoxygalactose transaminase